MGGLQRFERRLEEFVSGAFARAFRSAVQPVEISAALQRECDNNAQILSRQRRLVPNHFDVELSSADLERLTPSETSLGDELAGQLEEYAAEQGYSFPGPVVVEFAEAEDLTTGRFRVRSRSQAKVSSSGGPSPSKRAVAMLEVNGTRHPLKAPGLVVGRGTDADLRINDPGVSRRHIEFEVVAGAKGRRKDLRIDVRDLGSTNGMLVNGQKVTRSAVSDGSTVRIGNTTLTVRVVMEDSAADV